MNKLVTDLLKGVLKSTKALINKVLAILLVLLLPLLLALLLIPLSCEAKASKKVFKIVEVKKKSAMTTARFGDKHSCSLQHLGNNYFITATHCIDFVFSHNLNNLTPIKINHEYGLFKILYYTMDKGLTLTDGLAVIRIFLLDFSNYEKVVVPTKYSEPTNIHCYPGLRTGRLVKIDGKLTGATRLSKTRIYGSGDIGPGCSGGAWLNSKGELVGITSGGWGKTGLASAVVTTRYRKMINAVIHGHRPKLLDWSKASKLFRDYEKKRRIENGDDPKDTTESIRGFDKTDREGKPKDKDGKKKKKKCTTRHCQPYDRPY